MRLILLLLFCFFNAHTNERDFRDEMVVSYDEDCGPTLLDIQKEEKLSKSPPSNSCAPSRIYPRQVKKICYCKDPENHIEFGGSYRYADVKPHGEKSLTGHLGGVNASYEYRRAFQVYQGLSFAWREGTVTGSGAKRDLFDIDTQGRIGYTFGKGRDYWTLSLFSGLGYRHLGEDEKSTAGAVDYKTNDLYVPVGFFLNGRVSTYLFIGCQFQWRPQVFPTLAIGALKGARWDTEYMFSNIQADLPISIVLSNRHNINLILKPCIEYTQEGAPMAKTEQGNALVVPKVTHLFGGGDINFSIAF